MDYAIENDVGLTPDNPHIIYAESSKGLIINFIVGDPFLHLFSYRVLYM